MVGFWSLSSDPDVESAGKKERARGGERLWTGWVLPGGTSELGVCGGQERISLENVFSPVCQRIPPLLTDTGEKGHKWGGKRPGTFPKLRRSAQGGLEAWGGEKGPPSRGSEDPREGATTS